MWPLCRDFFELFGFDGFFGPKASHCFTDFVIKASNSSSSSTFLFKGIGSNCIVLTADAIKFSDATISSLYFFINFKTFSWSLYISSKDFSGSFFWSLSNLLFAELIFFSAAETSSNGALLSLISIVRDYKYLPCLPQEYM